MKYRTAPGCQCACSNVLIPSSLARSGGCLCGPGKNEAEAARGAEGDRNDLDKIATGRQGREANLSEEEGRGGGGFGEGVPGDGGMEAIKKEDKSE
jgi:hypothetical protein